MGPGDTVGDELQHEPGHRRHRVHRLVRGRASSCSGPSRRASRGRASSRWAARTRRSCSARADLEEAAEGIMRSAFGFGGQKCSANSRVYVEQPVHDELVRLLVEKTEKLTVGDPLPRPAFLGPVIDAARGRAPPAGRRRGAPRRDGVHRRRAPDRRRPRARLLRRADGRRRLPASHRLFQDELFAPFTAVARGRLARRGARPRQRQRLRPDRGRVLEDPAEVQRFLDEIDAGVLYVNRRAGATTGAWPGVQAFGGWKGSGLDGQGRACRCTTSRSSCGSRATRSSTDGRGLRRVVARAGLAVALARRSPPAVRCCLTPRRAVPIAASGRRDRRAAATS